MALDKQTDMIEALAIKAEIKKLMERINLLEKKFTSAEAGHEHLIALEQAYDNLDLADDELVIFT